MKGVRRRNLSKKIMKMSRIEDAEWYESDESVVDNKTTIKNAGVKENSKINVKTSEKVIFANTNLPIPKKKTYKEKEASNRHNVGNTSKSNQHDLDAFNKYAPVLTSNNIYDKTNIINVDKNNTKEQTINKTPTSGSKSKGLKGIVKRALRWHSRADEKVSRWYFDAPQAYKAPSVNNDPANNENAPCSNTDIGSNVKNNTLVKVSTLVDLENLKISENNLVHNQNNSLTIDAPKETSYISFIDETPDDSIDSTEVIFSSGDMKTGEKDDEKDSGVDGNEMAMRKCSIEKGTLSDGAYNPITLTVVTGAGKKLVKTAGRRISITRRRPSEIYKNLKNHSSSRGSMNVPILPVLGTLHAHHLNYFNVFMFVQKLLFLKTRTKPLDTLVNNSLIFMTTRKFEDCHEASKE